MRISSGSSSSPALVAAVIFLLGCLADCSLSAESYPLDGVSSGTSNKHIYDQWKRGFVSKDRTDSENTDASSVQRVLDRSKSAQEKFRQAEIASGYDHEGGVQGSGSAGAERNLASKIYDRSSFQQDKLSHETAAKKAKSRQIDSGVVRGHDMSDVNIGGGYYGRGSTGSSKKLLDQQRNLLSESDTAQQSTYKDALQQSARFDKGSLVKASNSAAKISQGAGYGSAGGFGVYGSAGDESARLLHKRTRGFEDLKQVAQGRHSSRAVDQSHDKQRLIKAANNNADIAGHYGSAGYSNAARLIAYDKGTLKHREQDRSDQIAYDKTRQVVDEEADASKEASVKIGQGLYGGGRSSGESAAVSGEALDVEFDKSKGIKLKSRSRSSTVRTFDTGVKQAAQGSNTVIRPQLVQYNF